MYEDPWHLWRYLVAVCFLCRQSPSMKKGVIFGLLWYSVNWDTEYIAVVFLIGDAQPSYGGEA
jgi:hypothetical protein